MSEHVHVVHLHSNILLHITNYFFDSMDVVVFFPVSVHNVLSISSKILTLNILSLIQISPPPWLAPIDQSRHRCLGVLRDHQGVGPAHGAVDIVGEVGNVVDGGEHSSSNILLLHQRPGTL